MIAFGPMIWRLGFYWDDWPSIWFLHFFGPSSFKEGFASDRPLLAWIFMLTTSLLGESTTAWQIFGIFTRWLTGLTLWWTLRLLWPRQTVQVTWIALLVTIYPGFRQQYISVTYSNAFLVYALYLVSWGTMILAHRKPQKQASARFWLLMAVSLVTAALSLFITEYFFGLELLRPVFLWILATQNAATAQNKIDTDQQAQEESVARTDPEQDYKKLLWRIGLTWAPYLVIMAAFFVWRVFLHITPRGSIIIFDQLRNNPFLTLFNLVRTILQNLFEVSLLAWLKTIHPAGLQMFSPLIIGIYAVILIGGSALAIFFLSRLEAEGQPRIQPVRSQPWAIQAMLVGIYAMLVAGWPIWVTNLHIELLFPWDRFTIPMMLGACIFLAGLVDFISEKRILRLKFSIGPIILGVLIGLSAGMHFQDALNYHKEWLSQKDFFWQLVWRAPAIQPGTTLLTSEMPFTYYSDNSLTAPLNWTYAPGNSSRRMSYMVYNIESRLGSWLAALQPGVSIEQPYRAASFSGSTDQALVVFYLPPRCLKIIDPLLDLNLPYKPLYIPEALPLSNRELILPQADQPVQPPVSILGEEPMHGWCYYFEKADLASQYSDWEQVVALGDQALPDGNKPGLGKEFTRDTASELVPFIQGYAHVGQWEQAVNLSLEAYKASPKMQNMLCSTWYLISETTQEQNTVSEKQIALDQIEEKFQCKIP